MKLLKKLIKKTSTSLPYNGYSVTSKEVIENLKTIANSTKG